MLWQTCKLVSTFHVVLAMWAFFSSHVFIFPHGFSFFPSGSPFLSLPIWGYLSLKDCVDVFFWGLESKWIPKMLAAFFGFSRFKLDSCQPSARHRYIFSIRFFQFFRDFWYLWHAYATSPPFHVTSACWYVYHCYYLCLDLNVNVESESAPTFISNTGKGRVRWKRLENGKWSEGDLWECSLVFFVCAPEPPFCRFSVQI